MTKKDKEWTVEYSDKVMKQMAENPEMAKAIREMAANMRQAMDGVQRGQYKSFDEAMESITGSRSEPLIRDNPDANIGLEWERKEDDLD